jgi:RNA polymerase sigma-70 factor (ECF subfamily)
VSLFGKKSRSERFEQLAEQHERAVYLTCLRMMGNREDALDCAQEAMLNAYRAFGRMEEEEGCKAWFVRIAHNVCIDQLRKRRNIISLDSLRDEGYDPADEKSLSPYARLEEKERMKMLKEAVAELSDDQRSMIVLRDFQNMSYEEIGEMLNVPLGTVKSRIKRAREKMKKILLQKTELFSAESVIDNEGRQQ